MAKLSNIRKVISKSVIDEYIEDRVTELVRQSKYGNIPAGIDPDLYLIYKDLRQSIFGGKRDYIGSTKGSKYTWEFLIKLSLYMVDAQGGGALEEMLEEQRSENRAMRSQNQKLYRRLK